jgi:protein-tyrosine-phosphatase/DNA-binding HxlR family transcriptional regulator
MPQRSLFDRRVALHAALGEAVRLAIVDDLATSDRSPKELGDRHGLATNLLAHHLDVLEAAGVIRRGVSSGDGRRRYVRLQLEALTELGVRPLEPRGDVLFLCTHNSARSQLAAALWTARTGRPATSAGTHPAPRVHRGAVAAAKRVGLDLRDAVPRLVGRIATGTQVITVCDRAHEELQPAATWWHWSIPDPVSEGNAAAFDTVVTELTRRIEALS